MHWVQLTERKGTEMLPHITHLSPAHQCVLWLRLGQGQVLGLLITLEKP